MTLKRTACIFASTALLLSGAVFGAPDEDGINAADRSKILEVFPELSAGSIRPSPIPGLYEIMLGGQISYVSADGHYLIQGDLYDTEQERNLTESRREVAREAAIDKVDESSMIVFRPKTVKHMVTVFTDIDCGYCRKLHRQIADYNALGIEVRYMSFPRSGPGTESWFKAEKVWCSDDRNAALTLAKTGAPVKGEDCATAPIAQHYQLGRSLGIRGTPAIVTENGTLIPGYVSPNELFKILEK